MHRAQLKLLPCRPWTRRAMRWLRDVRASCMCIALISISKRDRGFSLESKFTAVCIEESDVSILVATDNYALDTLC